MVSQSKCLPLHCADRIAIAPSADTDTVRRLRSPFRKRQSEWAMRPDDQRRKESKSGRQQYRSVTEKAEKDRRSWAEKQLDAASKRVNACGGGVSHDKCWDQLPSATVPFERSLIDTAEKRMVVMFSRQKSE